MVSTDSEAIAEISRNCGAKVPFARSPETSGDFATTADVIKEVIEKYREQGRVFHEFCCIYPTAPLLTPDRLKEAYKKFVSEKADMLIPVVRFPAPPQRGMMIRDQKLIYAHPENISTRSQDLEPMYYDSGQFYFLASSFFNSTVKEKKIIPFILSPWEAQDINTQEEWDMAERKFRLIAKYGHACYHFRENCLS